MCNIRYKILWCWIQCSASFCINYLNSRDTIYMSNSCVTPDLILLRKCCFASLVVNLFPKFERKIKFNTVLIKVGCKCVCFIHQNVNANLPWSWLQLHWVVSLQNLILVADTRNSDWSAASCTFQLWNTSLSTSVILHSLRSCAHLIHPHFGCLQSELLAFILSPEHTGMVLFGSLDWQLMPLLQMYSTKWWIRRTWH